ncbi:unnamed protein product [Clonostachys byssicola]|uniref:Uncharacterized protein n=1 Tax=Clonostachys byssicola TaxID=160290 RepID=A0A9N9XYR9_9HYPO|nr:unnamed protein product [Clonostachys byssicola]
MSHEYKMREGGNLRYSLPLRAPRVGKMVKVDNTVVPVVVDIYCQEFNRRERFPTQERHNSNALNPLKKRWIKISRATTATDTPHQ